MKIVLPLLLLPFLLLACSSTPETVGITPLPPDHRFYTTPQPTTTPTLSMDQLQASFLAGIDLSQKKGRTGTVRFTTNIPTFLTLALLEYQPFSDEVLTAFIEQDSITEEVFTIEGEISYRTSDKSLSWSTPDGGSVRVYYLDPKLFMVVEWLP